MKLVTISYILFSILIIVFMTVSIRMFPLQENFLGGAIGNYKLHPVLWGHANYDGDHYIEIARHGYGPLEYFYFPLLPILIRNIAKLIGDTFIIYALTGIGVSFLCSGISVIMLYKLSLLDLKKKEALYVLFILLLFPTAFYLQMIYTEGLFLLLSLTSFYFARKKQFFIASIFAGAASATKVIGFAIGIALFIEWYLQKAEKKELLIICLSFLGTIAYIFYLQKTTGDALTFISNVHIFGDQRSAHLVLLPQIFYRYIFKIIPNMGTYFPIVFTTLLEFFAGLSFSVFLLLTYKRIRSSYWIYMFLCFIIPTFAGSFSSMPRYLLIMFPAYIYIGKYLSNRSPLIRLSFFLSSGCILFIATALFTRGYWVS